MSKNISQQVLVSKSFWILFFSVMYGMAVNADPFTVVDTSKKEAAAQITMDAYVVFPEVLAGNEAASLAYIENFSLNKRAYLIRTYSRGKKYFPKASRVLKKYNLPQELQVLLALESGFNGNAISRAGAVGYWQIMDEVAQEYGLKYVAQEKTKKQEIKKEKKKPIKKMVLKKAAAKPASVKDERKNFNKSTYAAARYLKDRSKNLNNNLLLMVASYNCGIGNVWEALKKSGKSDPDFWDIKTYLPAETQAYVMNFITLNVIFHNYENFSNNSLLFSVQKSDPAMYEPQQTAAQPVSVIQN